MLRCFLHLLIVAFSLLVFVLSAESARAQTQISGAARMALDVGRRAIFMGRPIGILAFSGRAAIFCASPESESVLPFLAGALRKFVRVGGRSGRGKRPALSSHGRTQRRIP